jgi:hypothetical protein
MFKKWGTVLAVGVVLVMSGCSAAAEPVVESAPVEAAASAEASEVSTAAPIEMESAPAPDPMTPWGEAGFSSAEAWYIASMESVWQGEMPADSQLLGAGALACQQMAGGSVPEEITVVSGDNPDAVLNNRNAVGYSMSILCPS